MWRKLIIFLSVFLFAEQVNAAGNLLVRVEKPKSPTNLSSFNLNFVAMDILGRPITAKCFKQGPTDATFSQFGSDLNLTSGGNTENCPVTSSLFGDNGTYQFKVEVSADGDTSSETVSVEYDTKSPGDPKDYNKTKVSNCVYNIHFKSADDAGATVKIEIYRSENTSFSADDGSRVGSVSLTSNEAKEFPDTIPNCDKTYYYAVRAFDTAGNGSGIVGDSVINLTTTTVTTSPQVTQGAIPVTSTGQGAILGEETISTPAVAGEALGQATPTAEEVTLKTPKTNKNWIFWLLTILALGGLWYARRQKKGNA